MDQKLKDTVKSHLATAGKDKLKDSLTSAVSDKIEEALPTTTPAEPNSEPLSHKQNKTGKFLIRLFKQSFSESLCKPLGIEVTADPEGWFLSGLVRVNIPGSHEVKSRTEGLPRFIQDHLNQYLTEKGKRRAETSWFSVPYKKFIIDVIKQIINALYNHQFSHDERIQYLNALDQFISSIRTEPRLFDQAKVQKADALHFENSLIDIQQKISAEAQALRLRTNAHQVHAWLTNCQTLLGEILRSNTTWFYRTIHTQPIPENIHEELAKLGRAFECHLEHQLQDSTQHRIKMKPERLKHWQLTNAITRQLIKKQYPSQEITPTLLKEAVAKRVITWEQYCFYEVNDGHYTADQLLWELLYNPESLPLTAAALKNDLCYDKVLHVYRIWDKTQPHVGFLLLKADIQRTHSVVPRLLELNETAESKDGLIEALRSHYQASGEAAWLKDIAPSWRPGILADLNTLEEHHPQAQHIATLLLEIQYCQSQLAHLYSAIAFYRKLLPSTGELVGALALGPHLQSAVALVNQCGGLLQKNILELNQLLRFGTSQTAGLQTIVLQQERSWLDRNKKTQGMDHWLSEEKTRWQQGTDLGQSLGTCIKVVNELSHHCSPAVLAERVRATEKVFVMADRWSEPFLTPDDKAKRPEAQKIMQGWDELVHNGIKAQELGEMKGNSSTTSHTITPSPVRNIIPKTMSVRQKEKTMREEPRYSSSPASPLTSKEITGSSPTTVSTSGSISSSQTRIAVTSDANRREDIPEDKTEFLQEILTQVSGRIIDHIKDQTLDAKTLMPSCQQLITAQQETFYTAWALIKPSRPDHVWSLWSQRMLGFMYDPLPQLTKPKRFLWWHRHTLMDRDVFFRMLCVASLVEQVKTHACPLIAGQQERFRDLILAEQTSAIAQQPNHASWRDGWRCGLKNKFTRWTTRLKDFVHDACTLTITQAEHKSTSAHSDESTTGVIPTTTLSPIPTRVEVPSSISSSTCSAPTKMLIASSSLDLAPNSSEWKQYQEQLAQETTAHKEALCLAFLSATLLRITQNQLQISEKPEHLTQFHAAVLLFWHVIKTTELAMNALGVLLNSLQETFVTYSSTIQQTFFVTRVSRLLKSYEQRPALTVTSTFIPTPV